MAALAADLGVGRTSVMRRLRRPLSLAAGVTLLAGVAYCLVVNFGRDSSKGPGVTLLTLTHSKSSSSYETVVVPEDAGPIIVEPTTGGRREFLAGRTALATWLCANEPRGRTLVFIARRNWPPDAGRVIELTAAPIPVPCRPGARFYAVPVLE